MNNSTAFSHIKPRSLTLAILLAWPGLNAAAPLPPSNLAASLVTDRMEISAGSPLLVSMALRNTGSTELPLRQPLGEPFGSAVVQVKAPGDDQFHDVRPRGFGLKQFEDYHGSLAPQQTLGAHALVLCDREGRPVFDRPGRYELRATFGTGTLGVTSAPVAVEVKAASPAHQAKLKTLQPDVSGLSLYQSLEPARLARLREELASDTEFADAIRLSEAIASIRDLDADRKRAAVQRLEELRKSGRPIWKDLATEMLARHEARSGNKETARRLLTELPHRSYETEATLRVLGEDRR